MAEKNILIKTLNSSNEYDTLYPMTKAGLVSLTDGTDVQDLADSLGPMAKLYDFIGTTAEYEAAVAAGEIKDGAIVFITDDYKPQEQDPIVVDQTLDITSENAVSNKAVTTGLNGKADVNHTHPVSSITGAVATTSTSTTVGNIATYANTDGSSIADSGVTITSSTDEGITTITFS